MFKILQKSVLFLFIISLFFLSPPSFAQEKSLKEESAKPYKGSIEFGLKIVNGNSKEQSIYGKGELEYKKDLWTNLFKARAQNSKENGIRSKEEYRANNQTRYNFTAKNYSFGELEYVNDRFSGNKYRISEIAGYGRNLLENKKFVLSSRIGAGLRQNKFTNGNSENSWLARVGGDFSWQITPDISFKEITNVSIDKKSTIIESDTSLKIMIQKTLYLKFSSIIEKQSSVEPGIKNTDITTLITIGYQF